MPHSLKLRLYLPLMVILVAGVIAVGQDNTATEVLTNEKVITMVQAGLPANIIVNKIRASKTNFNTSTDELIRLKQANVHDDVINAMVNPNAGPLPNGSSAIDNGFPKEIGVFLKQHVGPLNSAKTVGTNFGEANGKQGKGDSR